MRIEKKDQGGKVLIDFFSVDDLAHIREVFTHQHEKVVQNAITAEAPADTTVEVASPAIPASTEQGIPKPEPTVEQAQARTTEGGSPDSSRGEEIREDELYSLKNFTV